MYAWQTFAGRGRVSPAGSPAREDSGIYVCRLRRYAGYDIDSAIGHEPRILEWGRLVRAGASGFLSVRETPGSSGYPVHVLADFDEW